MCLPKILLPTKVYSKDFLHSKNKIRLRSATLVIYRWKVFTAPRDREENQRNRTGGRSSTPVELDPFSSELHRCKMFKRPLYRKEKRGSSTVGRSPIPFEFDPSSSELHRWKMFTTPLDREEKRGNFTEGRPSNPFEFDPFSSELHRWKMFTTPLDTTGNQRSFSRELYRRKVLRFLRIRPNIGRGNGWNVTGGRNTKSAGRACARRGGGSEVYHIYIKLKINHTLKCKKIVQIKILIYITN